MQESVLDHMADKSMTFTNEVIDIVTSCNDENGDDNDNSRCTFWQ